MAKVLIEVPTYDGSISRATSESLWRLDRCGHDVDYHPRAGYGCAMARNRIAADALDGGYDFVLMADNDIELPRDALRNLMEHGTDFVMGWYLNRYARGGRSRACLFKLGGIGWQMYEAEELHALRDRGTHLVEVAAGGLGCALIRSDVFRRMEFPWFEWKDQGRFPRLATDVYSLPGDAFNSGGEDVNFCLRLATVGVTCYADTRVACGHEFREVVWPS